MARIYLETSAIDDLAKSPRCVDIVARLRAGQHHVFASLDAVLELMHARFAAGGMDLVRVLLRPLQLLREDLHGLPPVSELLSEFGHLPTRRVPRTFPRASKRLRWFVERKFDKRLVRASFLDAKNAKQAHLEVNRQARVALRKKLAESGIEAPTFADAVRAGVYDRASNRAIRTTLADMSEGRHLASGFRIGRSMLLRAWAMGQITNMFRGTTASSGNALKRLPGPNDLHQVPYLVLCDWFVLHDEPMHASLGMVRDGLRRGPLGRPLRYAEFEEFVMKLDPAAW